MTVPGLAVTEADGVLTIRFDRPEAFNALTGEMTLGAAELLERASARDDVRVVVLTGTGPAFSTGADIAGEDAHDGSTYGRWTQPTGWSARSPAATSRWWPASTASPPGSGSPRPWRATWRCAPSRPRCCWPFARVGLMPDGGATASVTASIGRARAMRLALLAEPLPAREAYDAGLVSHVVADADFDDALARLVKRLRARRPAGAGGHEARGQRGGVRAARPGDGARADHPDDAAPDRRRRRGDARVLREAPPHLHRRLTPTPRRAVRFAPLVGAPSRAFLRAEVCVLAVRRGRRPPPAR